MARITVEDCIDKFPSRFELVLVASQRAKSLYSGETPTVDKDNDKNTVIALREIADETLTVDQMKENLIQEYQVTTIIDEENENLDIESDAKEKEIIDKTNNNQASEIEKEIQELKSTEDEELKDSYEISDDPQSLQDAQSSESDEKEDLS